MDQSQKWASLIAQSEKDLPAMQGPRVRFKSQKDTLEKEMATHSSVLAWRIPWIEELGGLQSIGLQSWTWLTLFKIYACSISNLHSRIWVILNIRNQVNSKLWVLNFHFVESLWKRSPGSTLLLIMWIIKGYFLNFYSIIYISLYNLQCYNNVIWTLGEGNGNPLQYSCLGNPMNGGAWWATIHGITNSQTRLSN